MMMISTTAATLIGTSSPIKKKKLVANALNAVTKENKGEREREGE